MLYDLAKAFDKPNPPFFIHTREEPKALPDIKFMKHNHVVPKVLKLQSRKCRHDASSVMLLFKDAKRKHKDRILRIY